MTTKFDKALNNTLAAIEQTSKDGVEQYPALVNLLEAYKVLLSLKVYEPMLEAAGVGTEVGIKFKDIFSGGTAKN